MLKRRRVGMIVWGAILTFVGIVLHFEALLLCLNSGNKRLPDIYLEVIVLFAFGLLFICAGVVLLVFGIINAKKVTAYNQELNQTIYTARCYSCGIVVQSRIGDFRPHRRYPEGFVYCPVCRKPLSRRLFTQLPQQNTEL